MRSVSWINFILGLWLIFVGIVFSHAAHPVMAEEIVLGIIIAGLAATAATRPMSSISWLVAIAGLWTLIAPAVIHYGSAMTFSRNNDVVIGIVVLVLGVVNAAYSRSPVRGGM